MTGVLQGEPQSMAMIYQLVTQACEQLVHSKSSGSKHKRSNISDTFLMYLCMFCFFRGGVEA